jgi:hypothetical protein
MTFPDNQIKLDTIDISSYKDIQRDIIRKINKSKKSIEEKMNDIAKFKEMKISSKYIDEKTFYLLKKYHSDYEYNTSEYKYI